jgi:hypothetical protein
MNMSKKQRQPTEFEHQKIPDVPKKNGKNLGTVPERLALQVSKGKSALVAFSAISQYSVSGLVRNGDGWGWLEISIGILHGNPVEINGNRWKKKVSENEKKMRKPRKNDDVNEK